MDLSAMPHAATGNAASKRPGHAKATPKSKTKVLRHSAPVGLGLDHDAILAWQDVAMLEKRDDAEPATPSPTASEDDDDASRRGTGVVLFDPHDLVLPAQLAVATPTSTRSRRRFRLELEAAAGPGAVDRETSCGDDDPEVFAERMRHRVIAEICATEHAYVRDIRILHDAYIVPLEDNKHPIVGDAQIAVFFNTLRQLVMLNSKLLNDLLDNVEQPQSSMGMVQPSSLQNSPVDEKPGRARGRTSAGALAFAPCEGVGAVFCRYAPLFKLYAGYAKDFEEVSQLLQSYKRDSRLGFGAFLQSCQARSGSDKSFESLLIMPIQRIPRYKLLLERICTYTPSEHGDQVFLKQAVQGVTFAASLINESVRQQENLAAVLEAQQKFGNLSLVAAHRRLIRSGKVIKMSTKRKEEVMLHLFNDLLLYSDVLLTGGYRVRRVVQLNSKAVAVKTEIPVTYRALFETSALREDCGFVVTSLEKTFVLFATSPDERSVWLHEIGAAIEEAQSTADERSLETPADAAALWVPDAVVGSCTVCHANFKLYFRRHHCRRCGAVVCGNCSDQRSILFAVDNPRKERVCAPCFRVLQVVKKAAFHWLMRMVEFRGVLRRQRWNKWSEHYFELKAGVLKQYTLASANDPRQRCCTDTLDLTGAIVIHRSDARSQKNRFCFQISTWDPRDPINAGDEKAITQVSTCSDHTSNFMKKLSPLKAAVTRLGEPARSRDEMSSFRSEDEHIQIDREQLASSRWILCASTYKEEEKWSSAIQRSADKALNRARRSRVTECSFGPTFERIQSFTPTSPSAITTEVQDVFPDDVTKHELRRHQIMKEIVRSEESYVACLGECTQMYVQPLLLRHLEAQKMLRRRQSRGNRSFLRSFVASAAGSPSFSGGQHRGFAAGQTTPSHEGTKISSSSIVRALTASDARPRNEMIVLDADMAIFFSSVDQICTLNQQLLEHLSRHLEEVSATTGDDRIFRPGAIFNAYGSLFQLYTGYASRHESALRAIESPEFAVFLKELPEETSLNHLRTYLNMPMERLPRYKMFLQELLEITPPDHVDYVPLQTAIKSVEAVANKVQEIIARRESARKLANISTKVGIPLRGRRFVCDGMLKKVCRSRVRPYYFVLLEDALVYGRMGSGLQKKKFRLVELWDCKVSDDTDSVPRAVNAVAGASNSHSAFYFFSPMKSFILVADSEDDKKRWMTGIEESIERALRGPQMSRRASIRSELLLDEEEGAHEYELESAFVIKNGWLQVTSEAVKPNNRMWVSLTMQTLTLSTTFKAAQPDKSLELSKCEASAMKEPNFFRLYVLDEEMRHNQNGGGVDRQAFTLEAQSSADCEEWLRALNHCISGSAMKHVVEMRRKSLSTTPLAPIFMFNKVSNACMICYHSFAVYRPRHHCRICGSLVCGNCSKRKWTLTYPAKKAARICDACACASTMASSLASEL